MPTRDEYDAYFEPLIGVELNSFERMEQSQNIYEKSRNQETQLSSDVPLEQKARAEAMVAEMRRQQKPFIKKMSLQVLENQTKGVPMKTPTFDGKEVPVSDLSYVLAESLQHLYSSEDPKAEYYDWVNSQRTIEADYHVNGVSDEELSAGRGFAAFLDDRETEMKLVMSLYMSAAIHGKGYYKERAQEQLYFMRFKLRELRRIRTAIQEANRSAQLQNQAEKEREEQRLQKQAEHAAYMMMRAGVYAYELEGRFAERVDAIRSGAINAGDARERLAQIRERRLNIRDLISKGYRMGKSKEALEAEHSEKTSDKDLYAEHLRERGRQIRGFREDEYLRLNGRQRSYA